jgi:hypothetical protein
MSTTCPSCGVAVVSGYVRCPKCQKPLPAARRTPMSGGGGGTAVTSSGGFPIVPVLLGLVIIGGGAAFFLMRRDDKPEEPAAAAAPMDTTPQPTQGAAPEQPAPMPIAAPSTPTGPDAAEVAALIDRGLKKQRLWGTVEVIGARVDVRSGGCDDPAMAPLLDGQMQALKGAGLTKLRCLEQSGRVVFERDL